MPGKKYKKPSVTKFKPNCYKCGWRRSVPGDAHSKCAHPYVTACEKDKGHVGQWTNTFQLLSMLAGATKCASMVHPIHEFLGIQANETGVRGGWFNWPYNFDPVWLENCLGWTHHKDVCVQCELSAVCLGGGLKERPENCSSETWKWRWRNKRKERYKERRV